MIQFPPSLPIPDEVLEIARELERAGFETWCVGGAVRDNLLGTAGRDFDLATAATPEEVRARFRRTIPVGIEHGTVAVLDRHNHPHEVTTFRRDIRTDGRHAVVEFGASLEDDLARRDFTINAIAYHPIRREWRDLFHGREDLEARVVRTVGEPIQRFREDYLRILRGIRFATRYEFAIAPPTWSAMVEQAPGLAHLSAERVREEWTRSLAGAVGARDVIDLWHRVGALDKWLPEVEPSRAADVSRLEPRDPVLATAFASKDPAATMRRLKFSNADIDRGLAIARRRAERPDPLDATAVRRWMAAAGPAVDDLLILARVDDADWAGAVGPQVEAIRSAGSALDLRGLAVTGEDLRAAGIPAGPAMGRILRDLLDAVLADPDRNNQEELLKMAKQLAGNTTR